ncbi:hypothetical protein PINS_up001623 [Pythium insidiosum]|nr:hypothetical protein PINS_up001623 [Pythium insidiosum]
MAADRVRDRLRDLASFLENEHAVDSVEESVKHLQLAVTDAMAQSRASAQQCTIFLFESTDPPNLLLFLDTSNAMSEDVRKREVSHARIQVLDLLEDVMKRYGGHVTVTRAHVVSTIKRCQTIARGDWSNKVRASALKVIISVLKHAASRVDASDVEPTAYTEKLFYDLKFSKATQTAKGMFLEVIGHLANTFPRYLRESSSELIPWIEGELDKQFNSASPEMLFVKGLLIALARLLQFDPDRYLRDADKRQRIYTYLCRVLATTVDGQLSRYQVTKAALLFLAEQYGSFGEEIGKNGYTWYNYMKFCVTTDNKTVKENAFACSDRVMSTLGVYLSVEKEDGRKKTLNRILKELLPVLSDPAPESYLLAFALQCLGSFAEAIQLFLGEIGHSKIEDRLRKYGDNLLVLDDRSTAMRWSVFSGYVQCLSCFVRVRQGGPMDEDYIAFLKDVIVHLLNAYPRCLWKTKILVYKSILSIFQSVQASTPVFSLMDGVIYHALLLTISNATDLNDLVVLYHPDTGAVESKLLYEFEDLWVALLRGLPATNYKSRRQETGDVLTRQSDQRNLASLTLIRDLLFNSLVGNVWKILGSLNLSYRYDLQQRSLISGGGFKPNVARDHSILLNLTEFLERLCPRLEQEKFRSWIPTLLMSIFDRSEMLPLVSSFYRIARVLGSIADTLGIFRSSASSDVRTALSQEYSRFIRMVIQNIKFYKDELLVATCGAVMCAPLELVTSDMLSKAVAPALIVGKSYHPAADMAIDCLERWQKERPDQLDSILGDVVPLLAPYLDQRSLANTSAHGNKSAPEDDPSSSRIQRRILLFLGKSGGLGATLISRNNCYDRHGLRSDAFKISLELSGKTIDVILDHTYLQVGELAANCTDRRVKAAAAECYHALTSLLCGKTATHPHTTGGKSAYFEVWRLVFPTLIILATDTEKICRALFEPLLFQVTRWFCLSSEMYPYEYALMLDCFIDGISHQTHTSVREIAGQCLAACLSSCVEMGGMTNKGAIKAGVIFERLFSLCRHPGPAHRIGAATAMSYFLRTVDVESATLASTFALRCLKNLLLALRMCDEDCSEGRGDSAVAREIIVRAVQKLQRAISRSPMLFNQRKHEGLDDDTRFGLDNNIASFAEWVFEQCPSRQLNYRVECRKLLMAFAPIVSGTNTGKWLQDFADKCGVEKFVACLAPVDSLVVMFDDIGETVSSVERIRSLNEWIQQLAASLDCFTWCMDVLGQDARAIS